MIASNTTSFSNGEADCKFWISPLQLNYSSGLRLPLFVLSLILIGLSLLIAIAIGTFVETKSKRRQTRSGSFCKEFMSASYCRIKTEMKWPTVGTISFSMMPFMLLAEQSSWIAMATIYKDYFLYSLVHTFFLVSHYMAMVPLVYIYSFPADKFWNTIAEILKINIILQAGKSAQRGGYTYVLYNVVYKWQYFWSIVMLIQSYNFGLKKMRHEKELETSEWPAILIISSILSTLAISGSQLQKDEYGIVQRSCIWIFVYIIWRGIELTARVKLCAVAAAMWGNWKSMLYMALQLLVILILKMHAHSITFNCRTSKKDNGKKLFNAMQDSISSLFFFDLAGVPIFRSSITESTTKLSYTSFYINIFKYFECFFMALFIWTLNFHWSVADTGIRLDDCEWKNATIQACIGFVAWHVFALMLFLPHNFNMSYLREAKARSTYFLYDLKGRRGLNILVDMIIRDEVQEMSPEKNAEWQKKGLNFLDLMSRRHFAPHQLASLGFPMESIFSTFTSTSLFEPETKEQLQRFAKLEFDTGVFSSLKDLHAGISCKLHDNAFTWPDYTDEEEAEIFRKYCCHRKIRVVRWTYDNLEHVDNHDGVNESDSFSDFKLRYSHDLFEQKISESDVFVKSPLSGLLLDENQNRTRIIHVLEIPALQGQKKSQYRLLKGEDLEYYRSVTHDTVHTSLTFDDLFTEYELQNNLLSQKNIYTPQNPDDAPKPLDQDTSEGTIEIELGNPCRHSEELVCSNNNIKNWCWCFLCVLSFFRYLLYKPVAWMGYCNNACCCKGGKRVSLDFIINGDNRKAIRTGDVFLITSYDSMYLALSQAGHWAHCGLIYRFSKKHLTDPRFFPTRFRLQLEYWVDVGHIVEGSLLVFEMTNHKREYDLHIEGLRPEYWDAPPAESHPKHNDHGTRLTTLDWFVSEEATDIHRGNYTSIGVRSVNCSRDLEFWRTFFRHVHDFVDVEYCRGTQVCKLVCTACCPYLIQDDQKCFCSELVASFHKKLNLMPDHFSPSSIQPSDYGKRKGCFPCGMMCCCCFVYCKDLRFGTKYSDVRDKIYASELYILDNSSISEYKDAKLEDDRRSQSKPSTRSIDRDIQLVTSHSRNAVSKNKPPLRSKSLEEDMQFVTSRSGNAAFKPCLSLPSLHSNSPDEDVQAFISRSRNVSVSTQLSESPGSSIIIGPCRLDMKGLSRNTSANKETGDSFLEVSPISRDSSDTFVLERKDLSKKKSVTFVETSEVEDASLQSDDVKCSDSGESPIQITFRSTKMLPQESDI